MLMKCENVYYTHPAKIWGTSWKVSEILQISNVKDKTIFSGHNGIHDI